MAKDVSIKHVAEKAGVSLATVSLVVNEKPSVSVKTAQRVHSVMKELGYPFKKQPAESLPNGRIRRTNRIALCMLKKQRSLLSNSVYADVMAGIEETLQEQGMTMILIGVANANRFQSTVSKYSFDGLILMGVSEQFDSVVKTAWQYPCVKVMGENDGQAKWFDHILVNHESVARLAADYLYKRGHRHCVYLGRDIGVQQFRGLAFRDCLEKNHCQVTMLMDKHLVDIGPKGHVINHEKLGQFIDQLMAMPDRPTGMMVESDTIISAVYQHLLRRGIQPGTDLDVVSCNNERSVISNLHPMPAEIDVMAHDIGNKAAEQILWRIKNRNAPKSTLMVEPSIVAGD